MTQRTLFLILLNIALIGVLGVHVWNGGLLSPQALEQQARSEDMKEVAEPYVPEVVRYEAPYVDPNCPDYNCDIRLVSVGVHGESYVVVDNLTVLFLETTEDWNWGTAIQPFYLPEDSPRLVFLNTRGSSACCSLYSFDVPTKTFTRLVNGRVSDMYQDLPSSNKSKILRLNEEGTEILVIDVMLDSVVATVLPGYGETFVEQLGSYGGDPLPSYRWINDTVFEYDVFSLNDVIEMYDTPRKVIGTRRVDLMTFGQ